MESYKNRRERKRKKKEAMVTDQKRDKQYWYTSK